jgi:hypothetical protein
VNCLRVYDYALQTYVELARRSDRFVMYDLEKLRFAKNDGTTSSKEVMK